MGRWSARVLIIAASPRDWGFVQSAREMHDLRADLRRAGFEVEISPAVRPEQLQRLLLDFRPDILHFAGHGEDDGSLVFEDGRGGSATMPQSLLAEIIGNHNRGAEWRIRLIVLNACYSAVNSEALIQETDCVVGAESRIPDETAIAFAAGFYDALSGGAGDGDGKSVADAMDDGHTRVRASAVPPIKDMRPYPRAGVNPQHVRFKIGLKSGLHREYLRDLFEQPWTTLPLLDDSEGAGHASLLDVYVPLPVDFDLTIDTEAGNWWPGTAEKTPVDAVDQLGHRDGELLRKRDWPSLDVSESTLQAHIPTFSTWAVEVSRRQVGREQHSSLHRLTLDAETAASLQRHMVLVGEPGSGKSSFLRHLALCHAGELLRLDWRSENSRIPSAAGMSSLRTWLAEAGICTPLFIELHDLVSKAFPSDLPDDPGDDGGKDLILPTIKAFNEYVQGQILPGACQAFWPDLRALLDQGKVLILLDGLDEVPQGVHAARRRQVKALVQALVTTYPEARIIVSSRPYAYLEGEWELRGFGRTHLRLLSPDRQQDLARRILGVRLGLKDEALGAETERFLAEVKRSNPPPEMYGTPLFVTLLVTLWKKDVTGSAEGQLPASLGALYREAVDTLLWKWTRQRSPGGDRRTVAERLKVNETQLRTVLEILACDTYGEAIASGETVVFHQDKLVGVLFKVLGRAAEEQVEFLEWASGILREHLERDESTLCSPRHEHYRFLHWSFQEHLAACDLLHPAGTKRRPPVPVERVFPQGLLARLKAAPAVWTNVALLAAEELLRLNRQPDLDHILEGLFQLYVAGDASGKTAMLAFGLASTKDRLTSPHLATAQSAALFAITDLSLTPTERAEAGRHLATLGDSRPGVGLRGGLPEFDWCPVAPGTVAIGGHIGKRSVKQPFQIARFQVTYEQYEAFLLADDGYANPYWWQHPIKLAGDRADPGRQHWPIANHPAENVSWYDAMAFCRWVTNRLGDAGDEDLADGRLEIRLPTEAEWQLAAGGPSGREYPWEPDPKNPKQGYEVGRANVDDSRLEGGTYLERTTAVGIYPTGAAECGALDMSGNVWEWTLSEYQSGNHNDLTNNRPRVLRGGSWLSSPDLARASYRSSYLPFFRPWSLGFRVVKAAPVP